MLCVKVYIVINRGELQTTEINKRYNILAVAIAVSVIGVGVVCEPTYSISKCEPKSF